MKIEWPMVALYLGLAAIAGAVVLFAPSEYHGPIAALIVLITGAIRSYLKAAEPPERVTHVPGRRDGFVHEDLLMALAALAILVAIAFATSGCSGQQVQIKPVACSAMRLACAAANRVCASDWGGAPTSSGGEEP